MSKHTPGPWNCYMHDDGIYVYQDDGRGNGSHIQATPHHPEAIANARLIAAAPDLLSALETICSRPAGQLSMPDLQEARAALAKAKQ